MEVLSHFSDSESTSPMRRDSALTYHHGSYMLRNRSRLMLDIRRPFLDLLSAIA